MSTVKVQGNASGTGSITLASPNTNNNQTQTLPDVTGTSLVIDSSGNVNNTSGVVNLGSGQVYKDASGNVGIGTSSPAVPLHVVSTGTEQLRLSGTSATGYTSLNFLATGYRYAVGVGNASETALGLANKFYVYDSTAGATRMVIDTSGNLLVGTTDAGLTSGAGTKIIPGNTGYVQTVGTSTTNTNIAHILYSTGAGAYRFYVGYGGTVYATSTTITAISDQRLKENIRDLDDGLDKVMALRPRKFDWKEGKGQDIKDARGFIAQEFETVFPDMIEEWRDPAPEGEEPYKAVNANLIPTLVKAIQELNAKVEAQAAEIAALKEAK